MLSNALALCFIASLALAQQKQPLHAESSSTIDIKPDADGSQTVTIQNITYEVTGTQVPGRPPDERILLRKNIRSKQILGDIGMEATVTLEAWPLGQNPREKPLYSLTATGDEGRVLDNALFVVARGLEETDWSSVYQLGSGQYLFNTYVPLLSFSISREAVTTRYAGLDAPGDDTTDTRLRQPNVVAVLTYASEDRIIREALVTCDDLREARILRSYADTTRGVSLAEGADRPWPMLKLSFSQNYPSPPNTVEIRIPVRKDDLDLAHGLLPPRVHVTPWKRLGQS